MRFEFSEDQRLLQGAVRSFLEGECGPDRVRALWDEKTGRSRALWRELAQVGLAGALVPESHQGMGLCEVDFVLLCEEVGRAGLAEPVVATAAVGAPLLSELGSPELAQRFWPWNLAPINVRLIGSIFVATAVLTLWALRQRTWEEVRPSVVAGGTFATLALIASFVHFNLFDPSRLVTWLFVALYVVVAAGAWVATLLLARRPVAVGD